MITRRALLFAAGWRRAFADNSNPHYVSARRKAERIELGRIPKGGWVPFSAAEVSAWAGALVAGESVAGVRHPRIELGHEAATGMARIDFNRLRQQQTGEPPGFLARLLLAGEREVAVEAAIQTGQGRCRVDPRRVLVEGFEISGRPLDWLVENYLLALYPEAKVGQPFEMGYGIERLEIRPTGVRVKLAP